MGTGICGTAGTGGVLGIEGIEGMVGKSGMLAVEEPVAIVEGLELLEKDSSPADSELGSSQWFLARRG